ncbi:MAG: hypothetical protein PHQ28_00830, partial [Mycobacterium sp.]|nr:hypothetical protein [Mycobacterium sp.]
MGQNNTQFAQCARAAVEGLLSGVADIGGQRAENLRYAGAYAQQAVAASQTADERKICQGL